ncbi:thymidine kinase [Halobacteriales archaeon QH_10_67_22]|jgi:thymidine kinase|nr:MAG: thymidine kinase [Halobacteriales archaeon QH_10_67_22]
MSRHIRQNGFVEIIIGCMMSGKTSELIRRVETGDIAGLDCQIYKPVVDDRYSSDNVVGHDGTEWVAKPVDSPTAIRREGDLEAADIIAIDEVQFFDPEPLVDVTTELVGNDITVILAGLDLDFRGEPFTATMQLTAHAEYVDKLHAVCSVCGNPATRSQRLIDGEPAPYDSERVLVSGAEHYEPRCRTHHQVPTSGSGHGTS